MSYASIDHLQSTLSSTVFGHTRDAKKAAGRALGTIVEIISYYMLKQWGLTSNILIEKPLREYGNWEISHNVEFTLHHANPVCSICMDKNRPITASKIQRQVSTCFPNDVAIKKNNTLITRDGLLRNACVIAEDGNHIYVAGVGDDGQKIDVNGLSSVPFAMVECKRVGVEDGCKKGPQTIEKAKQGAYVARMTSSLQKIRTDNGEMYGVIYNDGKPIIKPYDDLMNEIVNGSHQLPNGFILSIGVVSNHGNWFTSDNQNKELKVLAQSYDWLLFLSDSGLTQFINELLLSPSRKYDVVKKAFMNSYKEGKKQNVFTKTKIDMDAHFALVDYFNANIQSIEKWFNVITPSNSSIILLKQMLFSLREKNWEIKL